MQGWTQDKLPNLEVILNNNNIDICCLSEHWQDKEIENFCFSNYRVVASFTRTKYIRGGVCIIAKNSLNYQTINMETFCEKKVMEVTFIILTLEQFKLYVISLYRSPKTNLDYFLEKMSLILENIYQPQHRYVITGDVNVNLLPSSEDKGKFKLINLLDEFNIKQTIFESTRITPTS